VIVTITKRYALEPHGRKRLELRRNTSTGETAVVFDGRELGRIPRELMAEGVDFALPDKSLLRVWIEIGPRGVPFINLTRNGHPLAGADNDPVKTLWLTCSIFWCLAALQLFFCIVGVTSPNGPDAAVYWCGALGGALGILGVFAWNRSVAATVLGSLIVFFELAVFFWFEGAHNAGAFINLGFALFIVAFLLMRGINAVTEIRSHRLPIREVPRPIKSNSA
jgi:hypothetical protein